MPGMVKDFFTNLRVWWVLVEKIRGFKVVLRYYGVFFSRISECVGGAHLAISFCLCGTCFGIFAKLMLCTIYANYGHVS